MFDGMDLQLFTLVLFPCVSALIGSANPGAVAYTAGLILAGKLVALGIGGIVFGVAADRIGRSTTMIVTVLIYSLFTGLSGLAQNVWQLAIFQGLAGIGIGGEWAAGAALVTETWPERSRARALIVMQTSFAAGFFLAAVINLVLGPISWRYVFAAGAIPAMLTIGVRMLVPEPARWITARELGRRMEKHDRTLATFFALFAADIRARTIVGVLIAASMMIAAFGAAMMIPVWVRGFVGTGAAIAVTSHIFMLNNAGAVLGYLTVIWLADDIGRRGAYFLMALGCAAANLVMFSLISTVTGLMWFAPIFGFFAIGGFGAFAIYLPELFPTRIRGTGPGFCWNAARILTAVGPLATGSIVSMIGSASAAGTAMTLIYVIGMIAIWFGPETRGVPLQD
jgi:MFS family permease